MGTGPYRYFGEEMPDLSKEPPPTPTQTFRRNLATGKEIRSEWTSTFNAKAKYDLSTKPTQRSPEEMRTAILALTDKLLAGLEAKSNSLKNFGSSEVNLLGKLSSIINQHTSGIDPLARREGEDDQAYRQRLKAMAG